MRLLLLPCALPSYLSISSIICSLRDRFGSCVYKLLLVFPSIPFFFFFHELSFGCLSYTLFPKYFRPLRTYSITIDPPPQVRHGPQTFSFLPFFSSQVDYIYPVSFSSAVYSLLYPCILSRHDQRKKVYYSSVKATNLPSLSHSVVLPACGKLRWTD